MRKRIFLRTKTSIPFQKTKDSNLGLRLTDEPQKQIVTAVCVCVWGGVSRNTDVHWADITGDGWISQGPLTTWSITG